MEAFNELPLSLRSGGPFDSWRACLRRLAKGRVEGARSVLLKLLALKFTALSAELEERIAHGSEADLEQWSERILSASSLDEVFHR